MPKRRPSRGSAEGTLEERTLSRFPYYAFTQFPLPPDILVKTYLRKMLPFMAKDIAFMNSVVLGTRANSVTPRNFSSTPEPFSTTSTTSTSISVEVRIDQQRETRHCCRMGRADCKHIPAIAAYSAVHANSTLALTARLQEGPSCPACPS